MDQPTTTTEAAPPTAEAEPQVEQQVTPEETAEQKAPLISDEARHAIASGFLAQVLPMLDRLTKQIVELQYVTPGVVVVDSLLNIFFSAGRVSVK